MQFIVTDPMGIATTIILTTLTGFIGYAILGPGREVLKLSQRISHLEGRFENLQNTINDVKSRVERLEKAAFIPVREILVSILESVQQRLVSTQRTNPLSQDEVRRLNMYIEKVKRGEKFSREEAEEFERLAKKLRDENPNDPLCIFLAGLAGFILGLTVMGLTSLFFTQKPSEEKEEKKQ